MNLLRLGDTRDRPTLHLIYKSTLECKARLEEYMNDDDFEVDEYATVFFESLENYQDELCSDIAMAASLVDVKSWAQGTLRNEVDCKEKLFKYIESFAAQYECDSSFVAKAQAQALVFINKEGKFNLPTVKHDATTMSARAFFDKHDATIPEFSDVARHLASKGSGSGDAERNWKETKIIYSKGRNRMSDSKRDKLLLRCNVLAQRHGSLDADQVDPAKEIAKYGVESSELTDHLPSSGASSGGRADADIRRKAFKAYLEPGEKKKTLEPETPGTTARFWLLTKCNGIAMYDDDEEPPEHRRIVDLEWQSKKPKGWKDKAANSWKQWKVVTELIPEEHESTIETEGNAETRYTYYINNALFDCILAAPDKYQTSPIEKQKPEDMEDDGDQEQEEEDKEDDDDDSE